MFFSSKYGSGLFNAVTKPKILCVLFVQTCSECKVFVNTVICLLLKTSTGNLFCARNDERLAWVLKNSGGDIAFFWGLVLNDKYYPFWLRWRLQIWILCFKTSSFKSIEFFQVLVLNFLPDCFIGLSAFCLLQEPPVYFLPKIGAHLFTMSKVKMSQKCWKICDLYFVIYGEIENENIVLFLAEWFHLSPSWPA